MIDNEKPILVQNIVGVTLKEYPSIKKCTQELFKGNRTAYRKLMAICKGLKKNDKKYLEHDDLGRITFKYKL